MHDLQYGLQQRIHVWECPKCKGHKFFSTQIPDRRDNMLTRQEGEFSKMDYTEVNEELTLEQEISQALARGYCHDKNSYKALDADLIEAMAKEVLAILNVRSNEGDNMLTKQELEAIKINIRTYPDPMPWDPVDSVRKLLAHTEALQLQIADLNKQLSQALTGRDK